MPSQQPISEEIVKRIQAKLDRRALSDVLRICAKNNIPMSRFGTEIARLIDTLYQSRSYGVILSAYYEYGQISEYTVTDLLLALFAAGDYPGFLKQSFRFGYYHEFPEKIEAAIAWHHERRLPDANSWTSKFAELRKIVDRNT